MNVNLALNSRSRMSLYIASLNSGSNGNCYYIGNGEEAVFVDAGLSCAETELRMQRLGLNMNMIRGVFISHEHSDHILGLSAIVQKYKIPVYINAGTLKEIHSKRLKVYARPMESHQPVTIGSLSVTPFPKKHDAGDPHSFVIRCQETTVGVFTDIGQPCEQVMHYFRQCHAAFLEANYDEDMLQNGKYPFFLKNRIRGGNGHLSNLQALELYKNHRSAYLSHLLLSHLSKENNSPELLQALFDAHKTADTRVIIASRHQESQLYPVSFEPSRQATASPVLIPAMPVHLQKKEKIVLRQLSLF
ncbi:MAG: MBL fold metallo-hydrolase [Chitinophagales bacterium]